MRPSLSRRERRGSAATEFALWVFPIMVLISGLVDFSWYMSRYHNVVRVARDAARTGAAIYEHDVGFKGELVVPAARDHAYLAFEMMNMDCIEPECTIDVAYLTDPYDHVAVAVTYQYQPLVGLYRFEPTLYSRFVMLHEYQ